VGQTLTATTILMLSVDEAHLLERSLRAALAQADADVVVVDNACTDRTASLCDEVGARRVGLRERRSYAAAINAGLAATDAPAVLLLNADCILDAGFLAAARPRLDDPGIGSVAPLVLRATGMEPGDRLDIVDAAGMTIDRRRKNSLVGHGEPREAHARRRDVFGGDGACVLYRREALTAVAVGAEVFDEDMELWASDADVAWRVRNAGWRCVFEPAALAWHVRFYSPGNRALLAPEHRRMQFRNRLLMLAKNETGRGFARNAPFILGYEVLALGHALLRERTLLRGYAEAVRLLPGARARRAARAR
jgi:GT2 family glycosyltransferase